MTKIDIDRPLQENELLFCLNGTLGDLGDLTIPQFFDKGVDHRIVPIEPVTLFSPITVKCQAPDTETFSWLLETVCKFPLISIVITKDGPQPLQRELKLE